MKYMPKMFVVAVASLVLVACSAEQEEGRQVDASGKQETALDAVPDEVLAAAMAASPALEILEAEYETRDGR